MAKKPATHKVHRDLDGFDIKVNQFGELRSNRSVDDINAFLNNQMKDKKLKDEEE